MSDQARLNEARALVATLDRLVRHPKKISPTAPWIIPATMIVVAVFALVCIVIKLIMNYLQSRNGQSKNLTRQHNTSPDLPTTPEDQTSMATTASMKTRGSLKLSSGQHLKSKPPPVSLYQMRQKQSPSSKFKTHKSAMKALSRAARAEANRSMNRDNSRQQDDNDDDNSNRDENSPNLSQRSDDTDEIQATDHTGLAYGAGAATRDHHDIDGPGYSGGQPETHIVHIRDLEGNVQQATWPQTESDI